ncbi:DoxX family protein [Rathayibacter sp. VKM Ac-2927]|uniref:DoxX family protein n=1 Tax=Rathayibacter sp. VKM Ac-2927 TaxID=2929478 RepID=UPI001FB4E138|nr:DoxX family protein [Rathayibacter sp. VKM Ac-2927]MCJ1688393.1 DoxX family protein [Rathayibacter sp. VKM Ac-2927]
MTAHTSPRTIADDHSSNRRGLRPLPSSPSVALLVLRLAVGAVFLAHGAQKVFVYGFVGTSGSFAQMGVPLADIAGPLVGLLELLGGLALLVGVATRFAALALALDMLVATFLVHLPFGIFAADGGYELPLALIGGALALTIAGAGRISVDEAVTRQHS